MVSNRLSARADNRAQNRSITIERLPIDSQAATKKSSRSNLIETFEHFNTLIFTLRQKKSSLRRPQQIPNRDKFSPH